MLLDAANSPCVPVEFSEFVPCVLSAVACIPSMEYSGRLLFIAVW